MSEEVAWHEHPAFDWILAIALVGAHALVVTHASGGADVLAWHGAARRLDLYSLTAIASGLLLTVASASVALYIGGRGKRLADFRRDQGHGGLRVLFSAVMGLLSVLLTSLVATALDAAPQASGTDVGGVPAVRWAFEVVLALMAWRFLRVAIIYRGQLAGDLDDTLNDDRHHTDRHAA